MIEASHFIGPALERGYTFWTGVPCSFLAPFINYVIQSPDLNYVAATSEGEGVGIAAGAYLTGRKTVVMCQNSGLGNTVNPLTSLNYTFRIPGLLIVTHRSAPGLKDEPQHELMGRITGDLLTTIGISWEPFPDRPQMIEDAISRAEKIMISSGVPFAFVMPKGAVDDYPLRSQSLKSVPEKGTPVGSFALPPDGRMARMDAIRTIRSSLSGDEAIVATTGHIGRELFALGHRKNHIYIVGSMGCASGVGLGIHEGAKSRRVVVLDGDGAALMKMGTLATIGYYRPKGLLHIILDNEAHESTGGQATASTTADFAMVAAGCGYRHIWRVESLEVLAGVIREARFAEGPCLVHVKVALGSDPSLPRPDLTPVQVKEHFMRWLSS
ncbi:MAG: phosphonopyruvate decarboxylase [Candidatus Omnitrophica bacterium]|nr:phosphonopyruvate decarboxylase [Candidatus Omnitrophota bacterium]